MKSSSLTLILVLFSSLAFSETIDMKYFSIDLDENLEVDIHKHKTMITASSMKDPMEPPFILIQYYENMNKFQTMYKQWNGFLKKPGNKNGLIKIECKSTCEAFYGEGMTLPEGELTYTFVYLIKGQKIHTIILYSNNEDKKKSRKAAKELAEQVIAGDI